MSQASCPPESGRKTFTAHRSLSSDTCLPRGTNYEPQQGAGSTAPSYRKHPEGKGMRKRQRMGKSEGGQEKAPCPSEKPAASPTAGPLPLLAVQHKDPRSFPRPPALSDPPSPQQPPHTVWDPALKHPPTPSPGDLPWAGAQCQRLWGRDPRLAPQGAAAAAGQPGRCSFGKHPALGTFIYLFIFKSTFFPPETT